MNKKTRVGVIAYIVIAVVAMCGVIALTVYDIVINKQVKAETLVKSILVLATLSFSLFRVSSGIGLKPFSPAVLRRQYAEHVGDAFSKDPKKEKAFFRAVDDFAKGNYTNAIKRLEAMERDWNTRDERFAILFFTAVSYDNSRIYPRAIELYEQALKVKESSTAASNLGICCQNIGDYEAAIDAYVRAVRIDPNNAYPYNNLAHLYIQEGEYEGALVYAEQALACKNNLYQAYNAKAICHAMMGDTKAYEEALSRAVAHGANQTEIELAVEAMRRAEGEEEDTEESEEFES